MNEIMTYEGHTFNKKNEILDILKLVYKDWKKVPKKYKVYNFIKQKEFDKTEPLNLKKLMGRNLSFDLRRKLMWS